MSVIMVAARARNHVIGNHGTIPWRIPADFAHFKAVTVGHPLILGRTTFEGIGSPLPQRQSIVLTRDPAWSYDGVLVAATLEEALAIAADLDDVINIGGGAAVYEAAMPHATHQILTEVQLEPEGDTHYPEFAEAEWRETERVEHLDDETPWLIRWLERLPSEGSGELRR
ncbi:MAG: dihydrofolate reductase [Marmoricola sp.]